MVVALRGLVATLRGLVATLRRLVVTLRGLVVTLRGLVVTLRGLARMRPSRRAQHTGASRGVPLGGEPGTRRLHVGTDIRPKRPRREDRRVDGDEACGALEGHRSI
ncbi:hypothetical protein [Sorangium sp. So ce887]|uniref:hypothetical protein n=1 Tax=Sorangium sp. So ce887 TaxID=3133324 RepID=UPI003F64822A